MSQACWPGSWRAQPRDAALAGDVGGTAGSRVLRQGIDHEGGVLRDLCPGRRSEAAGQGLLLVPNPCHASQVLDLAGGGLPLTHELLAVPVRELRCARRARGCEPSAPRCARKDRICGRSACRWSHATPGRLIAKDCRTAGAAAARGLRKTAPSRGTAGNRTLGQGCHTWMAGSMMKGVAVAVEMSRTRFGTSMEGWGLRWTYPSRTLPLCSRSRSSRTVPRSRRCGATSPSCCHHPRGADLSTPQAGCSSGTWQVVGVAGGTLAVVVVGMRGKLDLERKVFRLGCA